MPNKTVDVAHDLLNYLHSDSDSVNKPYIVHCMSVGCFIYIIVLIEMKKNLGKHGKVKDGIPSSLTHTTLQHTS